MGKCNIGPFYRVPIFSTFLIKMMISFISNVKHMLLTRGVDTNITFFYFIFILQTFIVILSHIPHSYIQPLILQQCASIPSYRNIIISSLREGLYVKMMSMIYAYLSFLHLEKVSCFSNFKLVRLPSVGNLPP